MPKKQLILFFVHAFLGLLVILLTIRPAFDYPLSNGKPLISFFIPLPAALAYFLGCILLIDKPRHSVLTALLLFFILLTPFFPLFNNIYEHLPQNDGYKYSLFARHIVENKTCWGGDALAFPTQEKGYIMQPGYRYFIATWLLFFKVENRGFQFFCMLLYYCAALAFLTKLQKIDVDDLAKRGIYFFILLSSPFVVKLILMGLTEWLVVAMLMLLIVSSLIARPVLSILLLALLPFFRQNLLIFCLLFFSWLITNYSNRFRNAIIFFILILLPVYHNLYYAGRLQFFSSYNEISWFSVFGFEGSLVVRIVKTFFYHIALYAGIDWLSPNLWANALAFLFIPLGTFVYVRSIITLPGNKKIGYFIITLSAILPTLLLGWAYYPRFEWVNLMAALLLLPLIQEYQGAPMAKGKVN